jgi:hypothetical protein
MSRRFRLRVANVFHAGDGNLHPLSSTTQCSRRARSRQAFGTEISALSTAAACSRASTASESKRDLMTYQFADSDLSAAPDQARVRSGCAFNPGKVFPTLRRWGTGTRARPLGSGVFRTCLDFDHRDPTAPGAIATQALRPRDAADVAEIVATHRRALKPVGEGALRGVGREVDADILALDALEARRNEPEELLPRSPGSTGGDRAGPCARAQRTRSSRRTSARCSASLGRAR